MNIFNIKKAQYLKLPMMLGLVTYRILLGPLRKYITVNLRIYSKKQPDFQLYGLTLIIKFGLNGVLKNALLRLHCILIFNLSMV